MSECVEVADPVFVQPHYDDIALSCGGTVARYAETGTPLIVTVCGGLPGEELTGFARMQHARWNIEDAGVVMERRREDACAARALGESVRTTSLDYLDAIYRRPEYGTEETLFGDLVLEDLVLIDRLADELAGLGDEFYMPLGVGNHVDHQLVFLAGRELARRGRSVWGYADLPYALEDSALDARLGFVGLAEVCERAQSPESLERRWKAIECYRSQLPVIFRSIDNPRETFEQFARAGVGDALVERFWRVEAGD